MDKLMHIMDKLIHIMDKLMRTSSCKSYRPRRSLSFSSPPPPRSPPRPPRSDRRSKVCRLFNPLSKFTTFLNFFSFSPRARQKSSNRGAKGWWPWRISVAPGAPVCAPAPPPVCVAVLMIWSSALSEPAAIVSEPVVVPAALLGLPPESPPA